VRTRKDTLRSSNVDRLDQHSTFSLHHFELKDDLVILQLLESFNGRFLKLQFEINFVQRYDAMFAIRVIELLDNAVFELQGDTFVLD
jgi:hypothetical protein